jgi:hypothetical protein
MRAPLAHYAFTTPKRPMTIRKAVSLAADMFTCASYACLVAV